jgi:hypothetical protein
MNEESALVATGEETNIKAADASTIINQLVTCLMGEVGRMESPDYEGALQTLTDHGVVDDDFEPDYD